MSENSNGSKPVKHEPEREPDGEHDLGRFKTAEAKQRSLANLRPWNSADGRELGMRSGASRRQNAVFRQELKRQLAERVPGEKKQTWREKVARKLIRKAAPGDVPAMRLLVERVDGLPAGLEDLLEPQRVVVIVNRNVSRFGFEPPELLPEPEA
jgi:hypothetical protein